MTSSQSGFRSVFVFPPGVTLRQIFAFLLMSFLVLFHVLFAVFCLFCVLSNFLTRFSAHFIVICRCLLAHTNGVSKLRRNYACALPSPSPFHYVMATIVPMVKLAAHAKSSTLYGQSYGRTSNFFFSLILSFFGLMFSISHNYGATLRALQAPLIY